MAVTVGPCSERSFSVPVATKNPQAKMGQRLESDEESGHQFKTYTISGILGPLPIHQNFENSFFGQFIFDCFPALVPDLPKLTAVCELGMGDNSSRGSVSKKKAPFPLCPPFPHLSLCTPLSPPYTLATTRKRSSHVRCPHYGFICEKRDRGIWQ